MGVVHFFVTMANYAVNMTLESKNALQFLHLRPKTLQGAVGSEWELLKESTAEVFPLPLLVQQDTALRIRHLHSAYLDAAKRIDLTGSDASWQNISAPSVQDRRAAIHSLRAKYRELVDTGAEVSYSSSRDLRGIYYEFDCEEPRTEPSAPVEDYKLLVSNIGTSTTADDETDFRKQSLRRQVLELIYCDDVVRCPYVKSPQAVEVVVGVVVQRCAASLGRFLSLKVLPSQQGKSSVNNSTAVLTSYGLRVMVVASVLSPLSTN